ncbi:lysozyme inhibitor LprI family protein [Paenisporosarcina indica]|uniref:lysozyme inhibitor LprI family protein n=1 Tax=Paenisporosarcina indica TaxID=650093 RepID=UPI00094FB603|nr:lysozyme inhibitor LprI family protein [Paenisporosarcina indica]
MKKLLLISTAVFLLSGCGNGDFDTLMEQGTKALQVGDFTKAQNSFELALEQKPKDPEALAAYEQLTALTHVETNMDLADWDDALTEINKLLEDQDLASTLKTQFEVYKETALENKEEKQTVTAPAKRKEVESTNTEKEPAATKIEKEPAATKVESAVAPAKTKSAPAPVKTEKAPTSTKNEYLLYLDSIEKGLSDLDPLYKSGTTVDLVEAESEAYKRWDAALNKVYGELKKQLSDKDMTKLREEQRQWIEFRDKKAKEDAAEYEGGSFQNVQYASTLQQLTKERSYDLVNTYMK